MNDLFVILLLLIGCISLLKLYFKVAVKYRILDIPNNRSSHLYYTIRGGGIIFLPGIVSGFIWSGNFFHVLIFIGLFAMALVSFLDDIKGLSASVRFVIHIISATLLVIHFWHQNDSILLSFLLIIGTVVFVNGFNFMDGINGITGIYSMVVLFSIFLTSIFVVEIFDFRIILGAFIALAVFGYYNFRKKAKCFAGDVGSVTMAFFIIFLLAELVICTGQYYYLLFVSVYIIDFGVTVIHRIILGEKISQPHRKHLYQLLVNEKKINHMKVAGLYGIIQLIVNVLLVLVLYYSQNQHTPYLMSGIFLLILVVIYLYYRNSYFHLHQSNVLPK